MGDSTVAERRDRREVGSQYCMHIKGIVSSHGSATHIPLAFEPLSRDEANRSWCLTSELVRARTSLRLALPTMAEIINYASATILLIMQVEYRSTFTHFVPKLRLHIRWVDISKRPIGIKITRERLQHVSEGHLEARLPEKSAACWGLIRESWKHFESTDLAVETCTGDEPRLRDFGKVGFVRRLKIRPRSFNLYESGHALSTHTVDHVDADGPSKGAWWLILV